MASIREKDTSSSDIAMVGAPADFALSEDEGAVLGEVLN